MSISLFLHALEQGFVFGIMVLGVFITYKILDFPDLTVEGSFPLGAAVAAKVIASGGDPLWGTFLSMIAASLAGLFTGLLHTKLKLTNLLSGILTMTLLYSVNLRIMGKPNIPLLGKITLLGKIKDYFPNLSMDYLIPFFFLFIVVILKFIIDYFLSTEIGLTIIATGDNEQMIKSLGVNTDFTKIIGLCLSNALVGLSGALFAQYSGFADVNMGLGTVVSGLACVIIGISIIKIPTIFWRTIAVLLGSLVYRLIMIIALRYGYSLGFKPGDLKLISVLLVIIALSVPFIKRKLNFAERYNLGRKDLQNNDGKEV
ncbi:ABC transporter permease [Candidatus Atribacteria bacterium RBG_19FT_COMBO_35_14]|uniref:ABC transporter permease n=1 Tax=Candidatus Sediminicultor quintus TaxID=1797291 RepID=A0A1F5A8W5_9BACT|nr:MAG: ABC transporter permease [Candidatus Atribacteria bacterium RBG_19FT_COMBO_35_14]OGD37204.1 MAG: ABC transporter permease [Candidatus Atribacteria bacterium RBG_16_35_8]